MNLIEILTQPVQLTDETNIKAEITWKTVKESAMQPNYEESKEFKEKIGLEEKENMKPEETRLVRKLIAAQTAQGNMAELQYQTQPYLQQGDFDLRDLAETGQITLLDKSEKYGALFFAYGRHLIVIRNDQLHNLITTGLLPAKERLTILDLTEIDLVQPVSFIKVCDIVDRVFVQSEDGGLKMVKTEVLL